MSIALGFLGIVMPLFPTTPFLLVALWAFSRSSPEMAERLRGHRVIGPLIRDWQDARVVPLKAKLAAIIMLAAMTAYVVLRGGLPVWMTVSILVLLLAVGVYIITRPSRRSLT
jgi:uncharacterized membrane protein YbaN (DUF454 family)